MMTPEKNYLDITNNKYCISCVHCTFTVDNIHLKHQMYCKCEQSSNFKCFIYSTSTCNYYELRKIDTAINNYDINQTIFDDKQQYTTIIHLPTVDKYYCNIYETLADISNKINEIVDRVNKLSNIS